MRPKIDGILESSLYVSDVPRSARFYEETFGFRVISEFGERGCAMHAGPRQVLLLFKKRASRGPIAARRRRRTAPGVRYPIRRIGQLGVFAPRERDCSGRKTQLGSGRLQPLLSRP
jgi:catechol 2,3-dioxygenase-like lactoylglutathione lyase family enzyme